MFVHVQPMIIDSCCLTNRALPLQVLPHTMLEKAEQFGDKFKLMLEARVVKVEQDNDKVMVMLFTMCLMVMRSMMILLGPNIIIITIVNNILSSIQFFSNFFLGQVDIHWTPTNKHGARGQSDHDSTNLGSENHSGIWHTDHFDGDNNDEDDDDQNHHHSTKLSSENH